MVTIMLIFNYKSFFICNVNRFFLSGKLVKPGVKTFQFHFALPDDLPSTFESSIAKVHYHIKIVGKAVSKFKKQKIVPFIIKANVNLNHIENYLVN